MLKSNRKNKTAKRKKLFIYTCSCLLIAGIGIVFYIFQESLPLYISPLPKNVLGSGALGDQDLSLLEAGFKKQHIEYDSITKSQDSYKVHLKNKSEIIIGTGKDIRSQLSSLQFILTRLTMEGRAFNQLDLRFDKPVIRFK